MVNMHCKKVVKEVLKQHGLHYVITETGIVDVMENITQSQHEQIRSTLFNSGLILMDNKDVLLIEKIKDVIIDFVHNMDETSPTDFSGYLGEKLNYEYPYLAGLFAEGRGTTIENFISFQKIERVKEIIIYNELNIKEITSKMNYSSVSQLSDNFKKYTGLSLSYFKNLSKRRRVLIEDVRGV